MRKILGIILLLKITTGYVFSQSVNIYLVRENVETVMTNSILLISDPSILDSYANLPGVQEMSKYLEEDDESETVASPLDNLDLKVETAVTQTSKFLRLPIRYSIGNASVSLTIPYFFHRAMDYSHGRVSTMGLGDMQLGAKYQYRMQEFFTEFMLDVKLPTGNANKVVDGFLVPLGTGSIDFAIGNIFVYRADSYNLFTNINFRASGAHTRLVEISYPEIGGMERIEYNITNGNVFSFNSAVSYNVGYSISLMGGIGALANGVGKLDRYHGYNWNKPRAQYKDVPANQNFFLLDLNAAIAYNIFNFDLMLNVRPPLYTKRNEANAEGKRQAMIFFRVSRSMF